MLGTSFVLTFDDKLFVSSYKEVRMYRFFLEISPQQGYGVISFLVAVIFFTAFILKNAKLEIIGLSVSGLLLIFILSGYLLTFPNIGSVAFFVWTLASFMTIVELLYKMQDEKEHREQILFDVKTEALKEEVAMNSDLSYNQVDNYRLFLAAQKKEEAEIIEILEAEAERLRNELKKKEVR